MILGGQLYGLFIGLFATIAGILSQAAVKIAPGNSVVKFTVAADDRQDMRRGQIAAYDF
ncbi:hypothetical protein D3C85_1139950 [compost metagenome]